MTFQILTLYLKPDVHLTGKQQEPTCRQALSAISKQLKPTALYQITFKASATKIDVLIGLKVSVIFTRSMTDFLQVCSLQ